MDRQRQFNPRSADDKQHNNMRHQRRGGEYFKNANNDSDNNNQNSDYGGSQQQQDGGGGNNGRRQRKPEQQYYSPHKPAVENNGPPGLAESNSASGTVLKTSKLAGRLNFLAGGNGDKPSPPADEHKAADNDRHLRQTSEPRVLNNHNNNNHRQMQHHQQPSIDFPQYSNNPAGGGGDDAMNRRLRDTRSVESNQRPDRQMKPPSGRRNSNASDKGLSSIIYKMPSNIESLPPRLQKKILDEHGLPLTFLQTISQFYQNHPPQNSQHFGKQFNNSHQYNNNNSQNHNRNQNNYNQNWSHTLPAKNRPNQHQHHNQEWSGRGPRYDQGGQQQAGHHQHPRRHNRSRSRGSDMSYGDDGDFRSSNRSLNTHDERDNNNGRSYSSRRGAGGGGGAGGFGQRKRNDSEYSNDFYPERDARSGKTSYGNNSNNGGTNKKYSSQEHVDRAGGDGAGGGLKVVEDWAAAGNNDSERFKKPHKSAFNDQRVPYGGGGGGGPGGLRRDRRNSQSSNPNQSRDNSLERTYRSRHFHNRSRKNSCENGSRDSSMDRQSLTGGDFRGGGQPQQRQFRNSRHRNRPPSGDRRQQWSSRENSADSVRLQDQQQPPPPHFGHARDEREAQNWRKPINIDKEFASISNQISTLTMERKEEGHLKIPGVIQLPNRQGGAGNGPQRDQRPARMSGNGGRGAGDSISLSKFLANCPPWYQETSEAYHQIHDKNLIDSLVDCDFNMQEMVTNGVLLKEWDTFETYRQCVQQILQQFVVREMKFCMQHNVENHIWLVLYYNTIELLKRSYSDEGLDEPTRAIYKEKALAIIDEGLVFYEKVVKLLEEHYRFSVNDYIGENALIVTKGLKFLGLALVSTQKVFLFLGDLARYRELTNETQNYGISRQWYTKAQQIMPNNGRPYYLLGVLSVYSKRKVDAVYYYMRNLMSANPLKSARENLGTLFDEIRKKYESSQKKRDEKTRQRLKEKEHKFGGPLRRETWFHPSGGRRIHRTTPLDLDTIKSGDTSDEEELDAMTTTDLNKRFITSYLHVHGKLITRIGMESFNQCAIQMLREFRAVLRIAPIPITQLRLLQLTALNMFAIESTQLKDTSIVEPGARSSVQECAISIALMMFGLILEKFMTLSKGVLASANCDKPKGSSSPEKPGRINWATDGTKPAVVEMSEADKRALLLNEDARVLLPSIKIWCDWLLNNNHVWNPPPMCTVEYKIGPNSSQYDPWTKLGQLAKLLEGINTARDILSVEKRDDYVHIRLDEDITLAGFTPLFCNVPMEIYCHRDVDKEIAQAALRFQKILYVTSECLCECHPPVLSRVPITTGSANGNNGHGSTSWADIGTDADDVHVTYDYICVVQSRNDESSDSDFVLESFSDDEGDQAATPSSAASAGRQNATGRVADRLTGAPPNDQLAHTNGLDGSAVGRRPHADGGDQSDDPKSGNTSEVRKLLRRKDELERSHKMQEKRHQRYQDILRQSSVQVHIEVRPKYLIPDTNCFIDSCASLVTLAETYPLFQLLVPLVVVNELDGLSKGLNPSTSTVQKKSDPAHAKKVADASKDALAFLKSKKHPGVKWVTTKGSFLTTAVFTNEDEMSELMSNDDKILTTAVTLCKNNQEQIRDGTRYIKREAVLLTTDRNLRVKALSRDVPVRELPDFIRWAGLAANSAGKS